MITRKQAWEAWSTRLTDLSRPTLTYYEAFGAGWQAVIDATGGTEHLVEVTGKGWTIQHPITDRLEGDLFSCQFNDLVRITAEQGMFGTGRHKVWLDRNALQWEEVL